MKILNAILLAALFLSLTASAQKVTVDVNVLTEELQKDSPRKDDMTLVWWIPGAYWRAVLAQEKMTKDQIEMFVGLLKPYTVMAVFDARMDSSGKPVFRPEADIRSKIRIYDDKGVEYMALAPDKIGDELKSFVGMVRPILASSLGPVGTNFHFIVFPGTNAGGQPIADPAQPGSFRVRLETGRDFTWKLPLSSLIPSRKCPVDGAEMNGNWRFCPFHGAELKN